MVSCGKRNIYIYVNTYWFIGDYVMNEISTISLSHETKNRLNAIKIHPNQSYEEVIIKLLDGANA